MVEYWHGGRRRIAVGDLITSPHERRRDMPRKERQLEAIARQMGYNTDRDPKRVYFTTDRELARGWAMHPMLLDEGGGALYRVKPVPPSSVESDNDYLPVGFSARRAEVLEVVEDLVQMSEADADRARAKYSTWEDYSTPMYDADGYLTPPPTHREQGAGPELYRHFGKWFPILPGQAMVLRDGQVTVERTSNLGR